MVYFTVRCDSLPGKEEELDHLLTERAKNFWLSQPGVKGFHMYGDKLGGWPERTVMIEVEDLGNLQRILDSEARKQVRRDFMAHVARVETQIQELIV
ncbi:MAG: hypothetical protein M1370_12320 [Bacteroidetes bacterium]|nr:hypothetical protein [Bacteroidota bacterium]